MALGLDDDKLLLDGDGGELEWGDGELVKDGGELEWDGEAME